MKDRCAHIGELTQFPVGDRLDPGGILDDPGIRDQKAGYIGPVFIDVGVAGPRYNRACDIRPSPGKGLDFAFMAAAVEAGDHGIFHFGEPFFHCPHGLAVVQDAFLIKEDHFKGIHKFKSQIGGHDTAVQMFSAGGREIRIRIFFHPGFDPGKLFIQGKILELQPLDDLIIAVFDLGQRLGEILSVLRLRRHSVQKVCHLDVPVKAFSRGGGDDIAPGLIRQNDRCDFFKLFCIGERAPAKLDYFHFI